VQIYEPGEDDPITPPDDVPPPSDGEDPVPPEPGEDEEVIVDPEQPDVTIIPPGEDTPRKYHIQGRPVSVVAERIEYLDENGKLVTESLRDYSKRTLTRQFASLDVFLKRWNEDIRKQAVIDELAAEGLLLEPLADEVGKDLDPFDLICYVAFDQPPLTRRERADNVRKRDVFTRYGDQARAVLEALLQKYQDEGMTGLDDPRILRLAPFDSMGTPVELLKQFGGRAGFETAVHELQSALYGKAA
jgi:type I restriction enzyme R subunit